VGNPLTRDMKYGLDIFEPRGREIVIVAKPVLKDSVWRSRFDCEAYLLECCTTVVVAAE